MVPEMALLLMKRVPASQIDEESQSSTEIVSSGSSEVTEASTSPAGSIVEKSQLFCPDISPSETLNGISPGGFGEEMFKSTSLPKV